MGLDLLKLNTTLIGTMLIFWLSAYEKGALVPAVFAGVIGVMIGVMGAVFYLDYVDEE